MVHRIVREKTPEQRIAELEAQVARLVSKRETIKSLPSEPSHPEGEDTPVVWFVKMWGGDTPYQYVANHVHGKGWIVSHQSKRDYLTWNELLDFALLRESEDYVPEFYLAQNWARMSAR